MLRVLTRHLQSHILAYLIAPLVILVTFTAEVDYSFGDNRMNLLTSQAILQHGSIRLDPYFDACGEDSLLKGDRSSYLKQGGHIYNFFPLGTPLVALPVVAVANATGLDMTSSPDIVQARRWFCAILGVLFFAVLYQIALTLFPAGQAAVFALIFLAGSQAVSTMLVGHWSHNVTTLAIAWMILGNLRDRASRNLQLYGIIFGTLGFMAYLSRPAAAVWVVVLLCWLFLQNWKSSLWAVGTFCMLMAFFMYWSHGEYGTWLPDYYLPSRLGESGDHNWWEAFSGNLLSPARGILPFMPLAILAFAAPLLIPGKHTLKWTLLAGIVLHLAAISMFPHWWAGWSYGPRLQTESIPAYFTLILLGMYHIGSRANAIVRVVFKTTVALMASWSIFVHTVQGVYEPRTRLWNGAIDLYPQAYIWDWEFPQFLCGYQPLNILDKKVIYANQLTAALKNVPAGSAFFFPSIEGMTPFLRRITRGFNQDQRFGDIVVFNEWQQRPEGRALYTGLNGLIELKGTGIQLEVNPVGDYPSLGEVLKDRETNTSFVVSNCITPGTLAPETKDYLRKYRAEFVDSTGRIGLLMLLEKGVYRWEITGRSGILKKNWFHQDFAFYMKAFAGECDRTPQARFANKPLHKPNYSSYVFILDEATRTMEVVPMLLDGMDIVADATFRITPK